MSHSRHRMQVLIGSVQAFERESRNSPFGVRLLKLFYLDKLIRQDVTKLLTGAASGPRDFYRSNSRRLSDTNVLH